MGPDTILIRFLYQKKRRCTGEGKTGGQTSSQEVAALICAEDDDSLSEGGGSWGWREVNSRAQAT